MEYVNGLNEVGVDTTSAATSARAGASGCVMESTPNIVILGPIMLPLAQSIGMNEIHFCIFMVTSLGIGFITPPLGLNLFVISGITGQPVLAIAAKAVPFVLAMLVVAMLLAFVPQISLFLVR